MRQFFNLKSSNRMAALALMGLVATAAMAGNGGNAAFGALATQLIEWSQGSLGIIIAVAALLVGLSIGVVKQSMMAVVLGLGIAIALYYGPTVITGLLASTGSVHSAIATVTSVPLF
jgi:conjugal transfer pilus assembly protein TraA